MTSKVSIAFLNFDQLPRRRGLLLLNMGKYHIWQFHLVLNTNFVVYSFCLLPSYLPTTRMTFYKIPHIDYTFLKLDSFLYEPFLIFILSIKEASKFSLYSPKIKTKSHDHLSLCHNIINSILLWWLIKEMFYFPVVKF